MISAALPRLPRVDRRNEEAEEGESGGVDEMADRRAGAEHDEQEDDGGDLRPAKAQHVSSDAVYAQRLMLPSVA
jgi:hypothetical protein